MASSGDQCDCGGALYVYCSRQAGDRQVQYLRCDTCGKPGSKSIRPADAIRRRTRRAVT